MNIFTDNDVRDKIILIRCDLNVPIIDGVIEDEMRIHASIPTLQKLINSDAKQIHILTHIGRPKGKVVESLSTKPVTERLSEVLEVEIEHINDFKAGESRVQMHENTRFIEGETTNGPAAINTLLGIGAEVFIHDAFGVYHRDHASTKGLMDNLPSFMGLLMDKEIITLSEYIPERKEIVPGLCVVLGGAKLATKTPVINQFIGVAEHILLGGALANTFLTAKGHDVGESLYQADATSMAQDMMMRASEMGTGIHLPLDVVIGDEIDSPVGLNMPLEDVMGDMKILDIGTHTQDSFTEILRHSPQIICNGTMGVDKNPAFATGTKTIFKAIASSNAKTIIGGGDTIAALNRFDIPLEQFTHVSTGGGAMLEFLGHK